MLGVSTSWKANELSNGERLFQAIERLQIANVELEYRITDLMFHQLRPLLKKSGIKVLSIHNFFPIPSMIPRSRASGDLFLLSSTDREERNQAVKWTLRTIECANAVEAGVVVLHCGRIDMVPEMETLYQYLENDMIESEEAQEFIQHKLAERERKKPKHLDSLLFSLERLATAAEAYNVLLGLENRYSYFELPGPDEFEILFREFAGAPLRYWHDVGHAQVNEALSFISQEALLKRYADHLVGIHYHDAKGLTDHLPPGKGSVDFASITPYVKEDTIGIVELKPGTPDEEVREGLEYLRDQGIV